MTGERGSALLAVMVLTLLMALLSVTAFSLASRDLADGTNWAVAVRAELSVRAGVNDVLADTGLGATSLPVGGTRTFPPLRVGGDSVSRSLERFGDSVFALAVTGHSRFGIKGPTGVRSEMMVLHPCDSVGPNGGLVERLCTTADGPAIRLLP
jgi:hypothetical protein